LKPVLLLLAALLAGCTRPAARPAAAVVIVDDAGDSVSVPAPARRVVSLSPATTELVFAIGAGDRLVGRTRWDDYPDAVRAVPDVGDGIPPNIEAVLARDPDLVLLYRAARNAAPARQLRHAGVAVLQLDFNHLRDVSRLARLIGPALGRRMAADSLAAAFDTTLDSLERTIPDRNQPRMLLPAWDQPPMAIGAGSFQSEILTLAGGRNIFADIAAPSAVVSIEAIASRDPDLVLVSDSGEPGFARRPEWQAVRAVRERRFVRLTSSAFGRPGPRAPELVRELRRLLQEARR
jgi:ABC-type Fe3+-hydroxamate transport system substrate-binding protein